MTATATLLIATGNAGKRRELEMLLQGLHLDLRDLGDYPDAPTVAEEAPDYAGNARHKANTLARFTGLPALADDSGLEVDALGGLPGVRSARFAGESASDADNIRLLLQRLHDVPEAKRTARFRCTIVVAFPSGAELLTDGTCEGRITTEPRGAQGFGYDSVFYHPPSNATFAEVTAADKQRLSHRAAACLQLKPQLLPFLTKRV